MSENSQELFEISKNLKSIAIIDFIPNDKLEEFDKNFSKFFGHGISVGEPRLLSWRPIEYSSAIHYLGKDKGIPEGLSNIQLIQVRHLAGVAQEIICNCELDKEAFKELFDKFYEEYIRQSLYDELLAQVKREVDYAEVEREIKNALKSIDLTEKYNFGKELVFDFKELASFLMKITITRASAENENDYFNARLKFIENLQKSIEEFFQNLIPGIYLSKKEKCLSAWIYDLSNSNIDVVRKAKEKSLSIKDINEWKSKFEYRHNFGEGGEYHGTHLSLIGWTIIDETYESVSLLGRNFIFGYGMGYKDSYLGNYKTNYIILKLKGDTEFWTLGGLQTETALTNLSKFLFPAEWIKHLYSKLLELTKDQRDLPILEYKSNINELSVELDTQIKSFEIENKKRLKSISLISKISEDLRDLASLIKSNTSFLNEVKNETSKTLSEHLYGDSKFWFAKIREEIRDISERQSLRIQYLHDTINTLNSFTNIKYQEKTEKLTEETKNLTVSIKKLTFWLVFLTVIIVLLTAIMVYGR
ncbi:MAG: hypothetical protein O8C62_05605 [Candidatus Methanoperedens sp.]|nr:hypothetical protein [Candidatus Methanoperedens sp.]